MGLFSTKSSKVKDDTDNQNNCIPKEIREKISQTIIRIKIGNTISTGFFMKMNIRGKIHYFLLTSAHTITKENIDSKITISIFYGKAEQETEKKIELDNNKRFLKCFIDDDIDATIIEILPEDEIPENKYLFPDLNYKNGYQQYFNNIGIYSGGYYSNDDITKFDIFYSEVEILSFKDNNNFKNFIHDCEIKKGLTGSPLINLSKRVIGINSQNNDKNNNSLNYGVFIGPIIEKINLEVKEKKIIASENQLKNNENQEQKNNEPKNIEKQNINNKQDDQIKNKKKKIYNIDDTENNDEKNEEINPQGTTEINKDKNIIEKIDDKKKKINDEKGDDNIDSKIDEETKEEDYNNINNEIISIKNKEQENSNNMSNESIKKEDEKVDENNSKTDELLKRLLEKEKQKKNNNPEPSNESLEFTKFAIRSPDLFNFIKSLIHNPVAHQLINNSPEMQQLKETDPEVFQLMDNTELMDKFFSPEIFKTIQEILEIDKNKDKIDNNNINKFNNNFDPFNNPNVNINLLNPQPEKENNISINIKKEEINDNKIDKMIKKQKKEIKQKINYFYTLPPNFQDNFKKLKELGFGDEKKIKLALIINDGDLNGALNYLLRNKKNKDENDNVKKDEK